MDNNAQAWIKAEVTKLTTRMNGFGMRLHGEVQRTEGRENYIITLTTWPADGSEATAKGSINGPALRSVTPENRTLIIQDKLGRVMHALMFDREVQK